MASGGDDVFRIISSTSAARLEAARQFLADYPPAAEVTIVMAPRGAADDFARAVARDAGATFGLTRFSLTQLAARAAAIHLAGTRRMPGSQAGAEAIAARAVFEAVAARELEYFAPVASMPGFPKALARTLHELRLAGVEPSRLSRDAADGGEKSDWQKANADIGRLLARVEEQLERAGVDDRAALFLVAVDACRAGVVSWADVPLVLLDVPIDSWIERAFVTALLERYARGTGDRSRRRSPRTRHPRRAGRGRRGARGPDRQSSVRCRISRHCGVTSSRRSGRPSASCWATSASSPRQARGGRPSRSCVASWTRPRVACRLTRWRCFCARRSRISACSSTPVPAPACPSTSIAAPSGPIPRAGRSSRCSRAPWTGCRRNASMNTFRSDKCHWSTVDRRPSIADWRPSSRLTRRWRPASIPALTKKVRRPSMPSSLRIQTMKRWWPERCDRRGNGKS